MYKLSKNKGYKKIVPQFSINNETYKNIKKYLIKRLKDEKYRL